MVCLFSIMAFSYFKQVFTMIKKECSIWSISSIFAPVAIFRDLYRGSNLLADHTKEKAFDWTQMTKEDYDEIKTIRSRKDVMIAEGFFESGLTSTLQFGFFLTCWQSSFLDFKWEQIKCIVMKLSENDKNFSRLMPSEKESYSIWNLLVFSICMSIFSMTMSQLNLYKKKSAFDGSNMIIYFFSSFCIAIAKWLSQSLFMKYMIILQLGFGRQVYTPLSYIVYFVGIFIVHLIEVGLTYLIYIIYPGE